MSTRHAPPPLRALLLAATAALALHALLLGALPGLNALSLTSAADKGGDAPPMTVRQIVQVRPAPAPARPETPSAPATPAAAAAPAADEKPAPVADTAQVPAQASARVGKLGAEPGPEGNAEAKAGPRAAAEPEPATAVQAAQPTPTAAATAASSAESLAQAAPVPAEPPTPSAAQTTATGTASDAAEAGTPPPTYRTQPAPPATMTFDFKRGLASGQAVLQWRPDTAGGQYTLTLQAQAFGIAIAGWNSSGRFDAAGLAPERYAETRRSREVRATNFQRAAGIISFSALPGEFPLAAGVQDRSSWMLQLGAILQANPELAQPGAQVTMMVVGTRGAPEPWVFTVMGRGELLLPGTNPPSTVANAVHLMRERRRPYDTRASVWLDPSRHHLPLKVQLVVAATGEGQEFELRQLSLP